MKKDLCLEGSSRAPCHAKLSLLMKESMQGMRLSSKHYSCCKHRLLDGGLTLYSLFTMKKKTLGGTLTVCKEII